MEAMSRMLVFFLCLTGATAVPVLQQPLSTSVLSGGDVTLSCRVQNLNVADYGGFWYRLRSGMRPEWVLVQWASGEIKRGQGITERFRPSRDLTTNSYILNVDRVAEADTAAYYCAITYNNQLYFSYGEHLLIRSRDLSMPSVQLYPPPSEQLASLEGNVTLSCLARGFYPGYVRARWTLDGEEAESEKHTGAAEATLNQDGTYSWSSYLTLPTRKWGAHARYACEVHHESSQEPVIGSIERENCEIL
ncbi:immunoglobulin lambda-1 light chain-like [Heterodontus francisci]|uniref:immunoglobulin lambda-1 light chain-like n=1 Tax=Heterodontus francisci TaxID=7792 RepID=UPI00355BBE13